MMSLSPVILVLTGPGVESGPGISGMSRDIQNYIRACAPCNQNKKSVTYGKHPLINYHAGAPMERVHLDFMGPLRKTSSGRARPGNGRSVYQVGGMCPIAFSIG